MSARNSLRFLLVQVRDEGDPMRAQEVTRFAWALGCHEGQIATHDLLKAFPTRDVLDSYDAVLFGGSGDYSAAGEGEWLERILDGMRSLHDQGKPTFASCWGFQAFARAMGGECVHDPAHAELGPVDLRLTEAGRADPVFGALPRRFQGQAGHEDRVSRLPAGAVLLASTRRVAEQAYTFPGKPIYATQFHPELDREALIGRLRAYPRYVQRIAGVPLAMFEAQCGETPEANTLLRRFVEHVFG